MCDMMQFPKDIKDFIDDYSFTDREAVYTNGDKLIPVFRVEQALAHYYFRERNILEIIKKKRANIYQVWLRPDYKSYNRYIDQTFIGMEELYLTEIEFNLIKRWLENESRC